MNCETCAYQDQCEEHPDGCYALEMIYEDWIRAIERTKRQKEENKIKSVVQ